MSDRPEILEHTGLLAASCVGVIFSCIVVPFYTLGVFVVPVTEEFGWTRSEFQLSLLFSTGIGVFTAPVVGLLIQRFGPRRVALAGLSGLSIALLWAAANTGSLWLFYLAYGAMALLGAGTIPVTWTAAVTTSFTRQRGLALGIVLSGTGLCAILVTPLAAWVTEQYGWRVGYLVLALLPVGVAGPLVYRYLRSSYRSATQVQGAANVPQGYTLFETMAGYRFWVLLVSIFLVYIAQSGLVPNLIPALTDQGISMSGAAATLSFFGVAVIVGRLVIGWLVDRFWAPGVAALAIAMPVIACLLLLQALTLQYAILAAVLLGFAAGAELDLMAFLASKYFGTAHYPKIYGVLYAGLASASGVAPALYAFIYEKSGTHQLGFQIGAVAFAASALLVLLLGRYPRELPVPGR